MFSFEIRNQMAEREFPGCNSYSPRAPLSHYPATPVLHSYNPMSSLASQNSIFRNKTTFQPRMSFSPPTGTLPAPSQPVMLYTHPPPVNPRFAAHNGDLRFNSCQYQYYTNTNVYGNTFSTQCQTSMITQYQTPSRSLGPGIPSLQFSGGTNVSGFEMPNQIQPYNYRHNLPLQDTHQPSFQRPKSGTQRRPDNLIDLSETVILKQEPNQFSEETPRKPLTAPHTMNHTPVYPETYQTPVSTNRPPEYNPAFHHSPIDSHIEPYSLQFGSGTYGNTPYESYNNPYYCNVIDTESMCGGTEMSFGTYTRELETLKAYSIEPETMQIAEEHCPRCDKYFTMKELKQHAEGCNRAHKPDITTVDMMDTLRSTDFPTSTLRSTDFPTSTRSTDFPTFTQFSEEEEECPHCKGLFQVTLLPDHTEMCDQRPRRPWIPPSPSKRSQTVPAAFGNGGVKCNVCFDVVAPSEMKTHMEECLKSQIGELNDLNTKNYNRCLSCLRDFPPCEFNSHIRDCDDMLLGDIDRFKTFSPNLSEIDWASAALTREQRDAMDYVVKKAKTLSDQADSSLFQRIGKLGFNKDDLDKTLEWIKMDSPIIIHVFLDKLLPILINETHYKNQFETGTSHGSRDLKARKTWENNIFNNIYDKAEGRDRVKYGVLNIVGDIRGVKSCKQYGDSFFILRKVRLRTSFASADSSHASVKIASCEHYKHVLNEYMDNELTAVIQVATKKKPYANSDVIHHYKEVQIHGPIVLGEHIDCVFYHERHRNDKPLLEMLDNFRVKNNCNVVPMEMT